MNTYNEQIKHFVIRLYNWRKILILNKKIQYLHKQCREICSNTMNMYPGNFAEDFGKRINNLELELLELRY